MLAQTLAQILQSAYFLARGGISDYIAASPKGGHAQNRTA